MFGTLMYDLRHNEPTFVENNAEAVINRNRRGKPHIACEYCRARKLRCNGNPTGCDRCETASQVCKYPANRGVVRKRKQSTSSDKDLAQQRQYTMENPTEPQSPAISEHLNVDPSLMYHIGSQETNRTMAIGQLDGTNPLPSPAIDLVACHDNLLDDLSGSHGEVHEQDEIDHWLASCSLLSPNGTVDMSSVKGGYFNSNWPELADDIHPFDNADDSGDDGASSQETQLEDFDMNDANEVVDDSSSNPCLSSSSLDMLLDENFPPNPAIPTGSPSSNKSQQPSRKQTPVSYKMSVPAANHDSPLLENPEMAYKKKGECRCLRLAAHLLEQLGNEGANTELPTMDGLLNCCREAIKGCESILSCTLCKSRSESMMLLSMAGQYLSNICEKTVRCYVDVVQQGQPTSNSSPLTTGGAAMWFRSYKIESASERNQVLRCLVTGQLTEFCQLIGKIRARVGTRKAQLAPLVGAERKIHCMRTMLMQCESHRASKKCKSESKTLAS